MRWARFLKGKNYTELTQEGIENLKSSLYIKEIGFVVKNLLQKKHVEPRWPQW